MPPPDLPAAAAARRHPDAPVLAAAVLAAASGSQLEATLHDIVRAAVAHVDARYGAMGVLSADGRRLDRVVIAGSGPGDSTGASSLPDGRGILGLLAEDPEGPDAAALTDVLAGRPPMRSFLRLPVRAGDAVFGKLYLTEKRTGGFTPSDIEITEALAAVAGLAIENARLAERAGKGQRWGQAATELATALLSGADPDAVLRSVSTRVAALTRADMAGVLAPSVDDEESLTVVAAVGPAADDHEGVRVPLDGTPIGAAHRARAARLLEDISTTPVGGRRAVRAVELTDQFGPALLVPLGSSPPAGLLVSLRTLGREPFEADDLSLLSAFAAQASVVLELARTQQRERSLQVQADRDRIARDLHDHVVQRIFATALSLDRLSRSMECQPEAAARLSRCVDDLDRTIAEIRAAIFELHQQDDTSPTVRRQLTGIVSHVTEGFALRGDVRTRGDVDELPRALVSDLLAVVRELVTNVVRHASASRVTVSVSAEDEVRVIVADDGVGLPAVTVRSGLANLADRAERRGGRLSICTADTGTEISWAVPR